MSKPVGTADGLILCLFYYLRSAFRAGDFNLPFSARHAELSLARATFEKLVSFSLAPLSHEEGALSAELIFESHISGKLAIALCEVF